MEKEALLLVLKLRDLVQTEPIYLEFKSAENALLNSDEVKILSYRKDRASFDYEDAFKHFGKNSFEALEKSKLLSEAIYNLSSNEVVKRYNVALKEYNLLLKEIQEIIFMDIL